GVDGVEVGRGPGRAVVLHAADDLPPFLGRAALAGRHLDGVAGTAGAFQDLFGRLVRQHHRRGVDRGRGRGGRRRRRGRLWPGQGPFTGQGEGDDLVAGHRARQEGAAGGGDRHILLTVLAEVGDRGGVGRGAELDGPQILSRLG